MWPSVAYISMNHWFPINFLKIKDKLGRHKDLLLLLGLWLLGIVGRRLMRLICYIPGSSWLPCTRELSKLFGD